MMLFSYVYEQNTTLRYTHGILRTGCLSLRTNSFQRGIQQMQKQILSCTVCTKMTTTADHQHRSWTRKDPFYPEKLHACNCEKPLQHHSSSFDVDCRYRLSYSKILLSWLFVPSEHAFGSWIVWCNKNHKKNGMEQHIARPSVHSSSKCYTPFSDSTSKERECDMYAEMVKREIEKMFDIFSRSQRITKVQKNVVDFVVEPGCCHARDHPVTQK
jgi:hypothetical protein